MGVNIWWRAVILASLFFTSTTANSYALHKIPEYIDFLEILTTISNTVEKNPAK